MSLSFPRIIHLSDIHVDDFEWMLWDDSFSTEKIKAIRDFISKRKSDINANIIINTGDLTECGGESEYKKAKEKLMAGMSTEASPVDGLQTFYSTPGNHDYINLGTMFSAKDWFEGLYPSVLRKNNFKKHVSGYADYPRIIHVNGNREVGSIILLDSLDGLGPSSLPPSGAQGRLGDDQLNKLRDFLNDPETLALRENGARIVVALHHHPFPELLKFDELGDVLSPSRELLDRERFKEIIAGRIDALLFGHQTNGSLFSEGDSYEFQSKAKDLNIPIISCMNLEYMTPSSGKIAVIDIEKNIREVYDVAGGSPFVHGGVVPVKPRAVFLSAPETAPAVSAAACVGEATRDFSGFWFYPVTVSACSVGFGLPKKYIFEVEGGAVSDLPVTQSVLIEPTIANETFKVKVVRGLNSISAKVTVEDGHGNRKTCEFDVTLPMFNASLRVQSRTAISASPAPAPAPSMFGVRPDSIVRASGGLYVKYNNVFGKLRYKVLAYAENSVGEVSYSWSPEPNSGQGTFSAVYEKDAIPPLEVKVFVKDEAGREASSAIVLSNGENLVLYVPEWKIPNKFARKISIGVPIVAGSMGEFVANNKVKVKFHGNALKNDAMVKIGDSQFLELRRHPMDTLSIL